MITATQLQNFSDSKIPFFESSPTHTNRILNELLKKRASAGHNFMIYSLYKDKLNEDEFKCLIQLIIKGLVDAEYEIYSLYKEPHFSVIKIKWEMSKFGKKICTDF